MTGLAVFLAVKADIDTGCTRNQGDPIVRKYAVQPILNQRGKVDGYKGPGILRRDRHSSHFNLTE